MAEVLPLILSESRSLPIIAKLAHRCRLVETIDRALNCEMEVSPGRVVLAMILDTLAGRSPLYRLSEAFATRDSELLLGGAVPSAKLNDDTVGRVLDRLYDYGTNRLLTAVVLPMLEQYQIAYTGLHHDTTSMSVWGDYPEKKGDPFRMSRGFSKNHRPDLKQFLVSLLATEHGFPLRYSCENGNASDKKVNYQLLSKLAASGGQLSLDELIMVADSALVTKDNLVLLLALGLLFVTRLPRTYAECQRVVEEAVRAEQWTVLGVLAEIKRVGEAKSAVYRIYETTVKLYGREYRAIVVHSDTLDKQKHKTLDRHLAASCREMEELKTQLEQQEFYCQPDAQAAAAAIAPGSLHRCVAEVVEQFKYGRGRPPKSRPHQPVAIRYRLRVTVSEIPEAIAQRRLTAGCFVLLSPVVPKGKPRRDARQLLVNYKQQNSIEQNFGFMKDPLIVNDLFLKKPSRIEALGLVLVLALMFWRLPEYLMRRELRKSNDWVEGWDRRPTKRPTTFMMMSKFANVMAYRQDDRRHLGTPLNAAQLKYLRLLEMDQSVFLSA